MVNIQHEDHGGVPDPIINKKQHGDDHSSGDGPSCADDSFETTTTSVSELTPENNIQVKTSQHDGPRSDIKSPTAPAPPRWRFVAKAKKADGYSSREAGKIVKGKSSHELGAEYVVPEITKDEETVTRRKTDELIVPDIKYSVFQLERRKSDEMQMPDLIYSKYQANRRKSGEMIPPDLNYSKFHKDGQVVGSLSIEDTGPSIIEVLEGGAVITHNPNDTSEPDISSRVWASGHRPKAKEFIETKDERDKWTNLIDDESPKSRNLKNVGKLNFGNNYIDEGFEGSWSRSGRSTAIDESDHAAFIKTLSPDARQMLGSYLRNKPDPSDKDTEVLHLLDKLLADEHATNGTKNAHDCDNDIPAIENEKSLVTDSTNIEFDSNSESHQDDDTQNGNPAVDYDIQNKGDLSENNSIESRRRRRFLLLLVIPLLIVAAILGVVLGGRNAAPDDGTRIFAIGTVSNGTDQPSRQPSINPLYVELDGLFGTIPWEMDSTSSLVPIGDLTPRPTSTPVEALSFDSPTQQPIAFIGGCPQSFIPRYSYEIGTQVQSQGIIYECIELDCGAYGNEPGSTDYSWKDVWKVIGSCSGTVGPTSSVSTIPIRMPSYSQSNKPVTESPSRQPTLTPVTNNPTTFPTLKPVTGSPTEMPSRKPVTDSPSKPSTTASSSVFVSVVTQTNVPSQKPVTDSPSRQPIKKPATVATSSVFVSVDTQSPTKSPSDAPSNKPTAFPKTLSPTTLGPSTSPTIRPSEAPVDKPTSSPSKSPSILPTESPSEVPTIFPYAIFEVVPLPSNAPTPVPSINPTIQPSPEPTFQPSTEPTFEPTQEPSPEPSLDPTTEPTQPVDVPTLKPTCAENGDFNLCLAIDMSGSVCGGFCENCGECNSGGQNLSICCSNFANMLDFSKSLVRSLGDLRTNQDFSVVHFATDVDIASTLENRNQAVKTINQLKYTGGGTNLAGAINSCQSTLDDSPSDRKNLILILTDGAPTIPELNAEEAATTAANNAKDKDTFIIPILIDDPNFLNRPEVPYLENNISSDGKVFVADFDGLGNLQDAVFEQVTCQANTSTRRKSPSHPWN